jgi:hypothetical protein
VSESATRGAPPVRRAVRRTPSRIWELRRSALVADAAVGLLLAVLTAVSALVIEDLVPGPERSVYDGGWSGWRLLMLGVVAVLFVLALGWRRWVHRTTGTLFYVRMLDEAFGDRHQDAVTVARRRRMDMQAVSRWTDFRPGTDGIIDIADACDQLVIHLETAFNSDRHDTGTAVATNMPWPVALAIGRTLHGFVDIELVELPEGGRIRRGASRSIHREDWHASPSPGGSRAGVVAWFTAVVTDADRHTLTDEMASRDVGRAWLVTLDRPASEKDPAPAAELAELGKQVADILAQIHGDTVDSELVVYARLPKVTALAVGKHLANERIRFFDRTHLMNPKLVGGRPQYDPMRVHPSQPKEIPRGPRAAPGS